MLKRLWRWLKRLIQQLFGKKQTISPQITAQETGEIRRKLTDAEYESLFLQLLARVNEEGWSRGRVKGFLDGNRINQGNLVEWLCGFGERLLASSTGNDELARRMVRLGELGVGEVSDVAGDVGRRLLGRVGETNREGAKDSKEEEEREEAESWFNQGNEQYEAGDFAGAIASYDQALKFKPDDHQAWNNRGLAQANLGQIEAAIASFDEALKFQPHFDTAWYNRGVALDNLGQFEAAIASYDQSLEIKPDFDTAWNNRGLALDNLGQFEAAIASYDQALKFKPNDHLAWYNRGLALSHLGQSEAAIASYDQALKFKPDDHLAWNNRGLAQANLGQYEAAIASYDNALKFQPNDHQAWYNRGNALHLLGQFEAAIAFYDQALKIKPDFDTAWNNRGLALDNLGQFEAAIASYDNALKFQPDDHQAWYDRGLVLSHLGQSEAAIASYNNALNIKPDYHEAWSNKGVMLANLGQYEQAISSYDQALKIKFEFDLAWINRGIAAGESVSCDPFLVFSSAIAQLNPQLNQRGYKGTLASYEEGLKYCLEDTHPEGWGKLHQAIGNAHYFQGRGNSHPRSYWYKAVKSYNKALKTLTAEDFPELHLEVLRDLIRVQLDLGETAKAEELQRRGTDVLRRLLDECKIPGKKKQLALKFASFQQFTVDLAIQSGNWCAALELAEQGKNACLSWLLTGWSDKSPKWVKLLYKCEMSLWIFLCVFAPLREIFIPRFSNAWVEIQKLLNPHTAIVYWHLSPAALHTFILKHNTPSPIVLGEINLTPAQRLYNFESWVKNWNEEYANYRKGKDKQSEDAKTWRDKLPAMLEELGKILDINAIVSQLSDITQLILIPHRDLHRFPLQALFPPEFTISYLPSIQLGLISQTHNENQESNQHQLLSIEHPNSTGYPGLEFAQVESEAICRIFPDNTRKRSEEATKAAVINDLPQGYGILHFTGHGEYNFHNPALSFLALADEDKLTLTDIRDFDLRSYQLVSLAACETAITGNHTITTEYVGLVSGFMSCGVASVVSTLWTVESAASALVMIQFYQRLQQGKSKVVALTEATQWLRNVTYDELAQWYAEEIAKLPEDGILRRFLLRHLNNLKNQPEPSNQPYNHPYFWAALTITGIF